MPRKFHWHRFVLGDSDQNLTLQLPVGHGASYAADGVGSARGFKKGTSHTARALRITTMMAMLNHSRLDLLKIDCDCDCEKQTVRAGYTRGRSAGLA